MKLIERMLADRSDELCEAATPRNVAFMKRFTGNHPLTTARCELRGLNLGFRWNGKRAGVERNSEWC